VSVHRPFPIEQEESLVESSVGSTVDTTDSKVEPVPPVAK
jgi:hypothetical protein